MVGQVDGPSVREDGGGTPSSLWSKQAGSSASTSTAPRGQGTELHGFAAAMRQARS